MYFFLYVACYSNKGHHIMCMTNFVGNNIPPVTVAHIIMLGWLSVRACAVTWMHLQVFIQQHMHMWLEWN